MLKIGIPSQKQFMVAFLSMTFGSPQWIVRIVTLSMLALWLISEGNFTLSVFLPKVVTIARKDYETVLEDTLTNKKSRVRGSRVKTD